MSHIPLYTEFNPTSNKSQTMFIEDVVNRIIPKSEEEGIQYIILSGARGSGKSVGVEYLINYLAINYPAIQITLSRISQDEIKKNMFDELKKMTPDSIIANDNKESMTYINKSEIKTFGYGDGNLRRFRGNNCHVWVMEEATEDEGKAGYLGLNDKALDEITMLVRNPGALNLVFILCNPLGPEYWLYEKYIDNAGYVDSVKTKEKEKRLENVHVFYSVTSDNKFLGEAYINNLKRVLSPKQAERDIYGRWVNIDGQGIYCEYKDELHYHPDKTYKVDMREPQFLSFDFNTGLGKPMSAVIGQKINDNFHFYDEVVLDEANTYKVLLELEARGFFKQFKNGHTLEIHGDASGWSRQSAGKANGAEVSDYGIIKDFLEHLPYQVDFEICVPASNPAIKARHNLVNSYLKNMMNEVRIHIYAGAESLRRGLKSTKLKKGSSYTEEETRFQHITTAMGYALWKLTREGSTLTHVPR